MVGRPQKDNLDYFIQEVGVYKKEERLVRLDFRKGPMAVNIYDKLFHFVLERGYYYKFDNKDDFLEYFMIYYNMSKWINALNLSIIIDTIAECGLIDRSLLQSNVITSRDLQMKYLTVCKRRKLIDSYPYWLLLTQPKDVNSEYQRNQNQKSELEISQKNNEVEVPLNTTEKKVIANNNLINVNDNSINECNNQQSISISSSNSNSKSNSDMVQSINSSSLLLDKNIDKKDKIDKTILQMELLNPLVAYLVENNYIKINDIDIEQYNDFFKSIKGKFKYKNIKIAIKYFIDNFKYQHLEIDNKFKYFEKSMLNSLDREYDNKEIVCDMENNLKNKTSELESDNLSIDEILKKW